MIAFAVAINGKQKARTSIEKKGKTGLFPILPLNSDLT